MLFCFGYSGKTLASLRYRKSRFMSLTGPDYKCIVVIVKVICLVTVLTNPSLVLSRQQSNTTHWDFGSSGM